MKFMRIHVCFISGCIDCNGSRIPTKAVLEMFGSVGSTVEYRLTPRGRYRFIESERGGYFPRAERVSDKFKDDDLTFCFIPQSWKGKRFNRRIL